MQVNYQPYQSDSVKPPRRNVGCAFWLLPLFGVIMLGIGLWFGYSSYEFYSTGIQVEGTVVRLAVVSGDDGASYSPVFRYAVDGREYEYESINASSPPTHSVGDIQPLLVDPEDPGRARANSFLELWLLPAVLVPTAVFMLLLAIIIPLIVRFTS